MRVSLNTHAPLTLPGMLSTAEHWGQSRVAMFYSHFFGASYIPSAASRPIGAVLCLGVAAKGRQQVALSLRQPRLAQPVDKVLRIFGVPPGQSTFPAFNSEAWVDL